MPLKLCPPHQGAQLSACMKTGAPTGGSTSAAALGMMLLELSVTLATDRLPSHENWKFFLMARPSGSVTTRAAEIIL